MSSRKTGKTVGIDASRANRSRKTGVEWYAHHVIQALKRIVPPEFAVTLYSEEDLRDQLADLPRGWHSRALRWPPRRLWTQARLSWEMLVSPPDALFVPAHVLPLVSPKRTIITLHDVAFVEHPEAYRPLGRAYLRLMYAIAVRKARILTVSEFSKREIVRLFKADPARVDVAHLGVDHDRYRPVPADQAETVARRYGIKGPYFLFVGRLERKKNLFGLLAAFRAYKRLHPGDTQLVLIGSRGYGGDEALAAFAGEPAARDVRELGYAAQEDMAALYSGALALVFPSWYEGFGLPVLEAFACRTPVITSNVASLPEIAGDAARYVDPADIDGIAAAMREVVDDRALRERLIAAGAARCAEFTWERTARETWEAIIRLLEK